MYVCIYVYTCVHAHIDAQIALRASLARDIAGRSLEHGRIPIINMADVRVFSVV